MRSQRFTLKKKYYKSKMKTMSPQKKKTKSGKVPQLYRFRFLEASDKKHKKIKSHERSKFHAPYLSRLSDYTESHDSAIWSSALLKLLGEIDPLTLTFTKSHDQK